eukprot:513339-Amphidinium_carterae.1
MYIKQRKSRSRKCWYSDGSAWTQHYIDMHFDRKSWCYRLATLCERWEVLSNTMREHALGYLLQGRG